MLTHAHQQFYQHNGYVPVAHISRVLPDRRKAGLIATCLRSPESEQKWTRAAGLVASSPKAVFLIIAKRLNSSPKAVELVRLPLGDKKHAGS